MHTYWKKSGDSDEWVVGHYNPQNGQGNVNKIFPSERQAATYVNYLNGGNPDVNAYIMEA